MPVNLIFRSNLDALAGVLTENIEKNSTPQNIFAPVELAIPSPHYNSWLPLAVSRLSPHRVAANLNLGYLESTLWKMLVSLSEEKNDFKPLSREAIAVKILARLLKIDAKQESSLGLIRDYLFYKKEGSWERYPDFELRTWNLSNRLAGLFADYEFHRHEMVSRWQSGPPKANEVSPMEACQWHLYRDIFEDISNSNLLTLPQLAGRVLFQESAGSNGSKGSYHGKEIKEFGERDLGVWHFFGFSELSEFHLFLLWNLGKYSTVHLYQFNVCREYWDDVTSKKQDRRSLKQLLKRKQSGKNTESWEWAYQADVNDNILLKSWGIPGRELKKGFEDKSAIMEPVVDDEEGYAKPANLLQALQYRVYRRIAPGDPDFRTAKLPQDKSLQIGACSDIYREVETVYNSIIHNLAVDSTLKTTDVSVLVPDMKKYKPVIESVFSGEPALAYNLTDSKAESDSMYAAAVLQLLNLAEGYMTRDEISKIFSNPCFMEAAGLNHNDVNQWNRWIKELNIYRWADANHKREEAPAFTEGKYSWSWGLGRMRMGRIMDPTQRESRLRLPPAYSDMQSRNPQDMNRFTALVELLLVKLRRLSSLGKTSAGDWLIQINGLLEAFLQIPPDRKEELSVRRQLQQSLIEFSELADSIALKPDFALFKQIVVSSVGGISSRKGRYGIGGVSVASIKNARPIPFKIVYVLGLEEGSFPAETVESTLDLRLSQREIGDLNPREHGLYRFLEVFMSVQQKLYLTYIKMDLQKEEVFQPGYGIQPLLAALEDVALEPDTSKIQSGLVEDFEMSFKGVRVPLTGFSRLNWFAKPEYTDLLENYSGLYKKISRAQIFPEHFKTPVQTPRGGFAEIKTPEVQASQTQMPFRINHVRDFLLNPVEGSMKIHLAMYDDEEDEYEGVQDEPFYSGFPVDGNILKEVLNSCLENLVRLPAQTVDLRAQLEKVYHKFRLTGETPDAAYSELDEKNILSLCDAMWENFLVYKDFLLKSIGFHPEYDVEKNQLENPEDDNFFQFKGFPLTPTGMVNNIWIDSQSGDVNYLYWKNSSQVKIADVIPGFIIYCLLNYRRKKTPGKFNGIAVGKGKTVGNTKESRKRWFYRFESEKACAGYVEFLLEAIMGKEAFYWLPFEVVDDLVQKENFLNLETELQNQMLMAEIQEKISDPYTRFPRLRGAQMLPVKVPDNSMEMAKKLFEPIWAFQTVDGVSDA